MIEHIRKWLLDPKSIRVGSTLILSIDGKQKVLELVSKQDINLEENMISVDSPVIERIRSGEKEFDYNGFHYNLIDIE